MRRSATRRRVAIAATAAMLPIAIAATEQPAAARTFEVTRPGDDGRGTLRSAIERSNRHRGRDHVVFARSLGRDIRVRRDLTVKGPLTIVGRGRKGPALAGRKPIGSAAITTKGEGKRPKLALRRVRAENVSVAVETPLLISDSTFVADKPRADAIYLGGSARISGTRMSGWRTGISAYEAGEIEIDGATITGNTVGAEFQYSSGAISDSSISRNGAGLNAFVQAGVSVENTEISGNSPEGGVTVSYYAGVSVRRSTIAGNEAPDGGGISVSDAADAVIRNSTLSGNSATDPEGSRGGAIYGAVGRELTVSASTITGNEADEGSAIFLRTEYRGDRTVVESSIIAGNPSTGGAECVSIDQSNPLPIQPVSRGGNVFGPGGCGTAAASDILSPSPGLAPLAENGGPTPTHALLPGSPAIGHGLDLGLRTDQRGVARDGEPDSGSFERR